MQGYLTAENAHGGARNTIATCLLTAMCGFTREPFVTYITYVLLRHRARYIHDHVIVLFDIIVQEINSLGESTCLSNIMYSHARP